MYGQMTAGSWIYIGTQGILQGTYETFAELARQHFGGTLARPGRADRRPRRDGRRPAARGDDERRRLPRDRGRRGARPAAPRHRLRRPADARSRTRRSRGRAARPRPAGRESIALVGNAAEIEPAWATAGERFDVVTDQTSAHDALVGYVPAEISLDDARDAARRPARRVRPPLDGARWPTTSGRCSRSRRAGAVVFDYGNNLRAQALDGRRRERVRLPGLRAGVHPAAVLRGPRPVPLGRAQRRPGRHRPDRRGDPRALPGRRRACAAGSRWPQAKVPFQGLPARICWLGYGERAKAGPRVQRARRARARSRRRSSSAATTSTRARSPHRTARRRRWPTAPTRSPTGRSSTRS